MAKKSYHFAKWNERRILFSCMHTMLGIVVRDNTNIFFIKQKNIEKDLNNFIRLLKIRNSCFTRRSELALCVKQLFPLQI